MGVLAFPHWETVSSEMQNSLTWLGEQDFTSKFYLAGGTALALRFGHRKSVDLDFFSHLDDVHTNSRQNIGNLFAQRGGEIIESTDGNLVLLSDNVRVGFFSYGYALLEPFSSLENIQIASVLDIGLMKLDALIGRGSRKDFYDLYMVAQQIPFSELLQASQRKYPTFRDFALMALESMVMFENAERDYQPELLVELPWSQVQQFFIEQSKNLGKTWFGI